MKPLEAAAEDLRRIGVAAIVTGLAGGFLEDKVPGIAAVVAAALGVVLNAVGYWVHWEAERRE